MHAINKSKVIVLLIMVVAGWLLSPYEVDAATLPTVRSPSALLQSEIQKMVDAGHLRPAYSQVNEAYAFVSYPSHNINDNMDDLFRNGADTIYALIRTLPYLPSGNYPGSSQTWTQKVQDYIRSEYTTCRPYQYSHCGATGARRERNEVPRRYVSSSGVIDAGRFSMEQDPYVMFSGWTGWSFNPFNYYALYKYAQTFNNASTVLNDLNTANHTPENYLNSNRTASYFQSHPHVLNSYIAGYIGYLGLQRLAGVTQSSTVAGWLDSAQTLRLSHLPTNASDARTYVTNMRAVEAGGFLWVVPEFADYLNTNGRDRVVLVVNEYQNQAPYWFMARAPETTRADPGDSQGSLTDTRGLNEGAMSDLYQYWSLFTAKAKILKESQSQLTGYLDTPGVWRGDLHYIHNLVSVLEAGGTIPTTAPTTNPTTAPTATPVPVPGDTDNDGDVDGVDYARWLMHYGEYITGAENGNFNGDSIVDGLDYAIWVMNYNPNP